MKLFRSILAVVLMVSLFVLPVSAEEFTPSAEEKNGPGLVVIPGDGRGIVGMIHDENGVFLENVYEGEVVITPVKDLDDTDLPEEIKKALEDAMDELGEKDFEELVSDFEELWNRLTDGAPLDNAVISGLFDIRVIGEKEALLDGDNTLTLSFRLQGVTEEDYFLLLGKLLGDGKWKNVDYTVSEDGIITVNLTEETPFAVVVDNGNAPVVDPDAPDSPQTGADAVSLWAIVGTLICGAAAVLFAVKAKKQA